MRLPKNAVLLDPRRGALHRLGGEAAAMDPSIHFALQQPGRFEDADVFGDGWEGNAEGLRQFGDHGFALGEAGQDGAARGIGESAEGGVQESLGIFNHMV